MKLSLILFAMLVCVSAEIPYKNNSTDLVCKKTYHRATNDKCYKLAKSESYCCKSLQDAGCCQIWERCAIVKRCPKKKYCVHHKTKKYICIQLYRGLN